ncbi:MAG: hypothetical protein AB7V55_03280, partial [Oscillospiraceae bacterium]
IKQAGFCHSHYAKTCVQTAPVFHQGVPGLFSSVLSQMAGAKLFQTAKPAVLSREQGKTAKAPLMVGETV